MRAADLFESQSGFAIYIDNQPATWHPTKSEAQAQLADLEQKLVAIYARHRKPLPHVEIRPSVLDETVNNPKYLGPTEKVHINKKGWQIPLNKKGFGGS